MMKLSAGIGLLAVLCLQLGSLTGSAEWGGYQTYSSRGGYIHTQPRNGDRKIYTPSIREFNRNWDSVRTFPLTQPLDKPLQVYVNNESRLFQPHYARYVVESLDAWSDALDGRLSYRLVNTSRRANIKVYWVAGFQEPSQAGEATYSPGNAMVQIKTISIPDKEIKGNLMHELGHALGISTHSPYQSDIMTGVRQWNRNPHYEPRLSSRDKEAIRLLYSPAWKRGENLYAAITQYPYSRATSRRPWYQ